MPANLTDGGFAPNGAYLQFRVSRNKKRVAAHRRKIVHQNRRYVFPRRGIDGPVYRLVSPLQAESLIDVPVAFPSPALTQTAGDRAAMRKSL